VKVQAWLQAFRDGLLVNDWETLRLEANGRVAILRVSADAVRIRRGCGTVRETAGAYAYQQVADLFGALMPTAKILEERHRQAATKIEPMVATLVKKAGTVGTVNATEASLAIDRAVQTAAVDPALPRFVSNVGKQFILDRGCTAQKAVNHGFIVHSSQCRQGMWRGTRVVQSSALGPDWWVIQRRGMAHGFGPAVDQDDYSQMLILVDDVCELDGVEFPTASLYTDPRLAPLVTHDGQPLPWSRHPGVPSPVEKPAVASPKPPAPVTSDEDAPTFIPAQKTVVTPSEVADALVDAWRLRFGKDPRRESLLVLLAQWAFETGRGKSMWNYNMGNQKGKPDGSDGCSWTFFACNELLPVKQANALFAKAGPRRDGGPGNNVAITATKGDTATVWFYPDHPACCFRAYRTLQGGAVDYLKLLHKRFASAWPAVEAGDPAQFSKLLKAARYYTAEEEHYTRSLVSIYNEFSRTLARSA